MGYEVLRLANDWHVTFVKLGRIERMKADKIHNKFLSLSNSGIRPKMKQLRRKDMGSPTSRFARRSNSLSYSLIEPFCVNLNNVPF